MARKVQRKGGGQPICSRDYRRMEKPEVRSGGSRTLKLLLRWNGCQLQRKAGTNISTDGVHEGAGGGCGKRDSEGAEGL